MFRPSDITAYVTAMMVAFMKPLSDGKKNGSTIPITMSAPASARFHQRGKPRRRGCPPLSQPPPEPAHPASLVSSPSSPRGRRTMITIR